MAARYVNLGCGARYHRSWLNIDVVAAGPHVMVHDLRRGIPLDSASCQVVYHAHVLEHFRRDDAQAFLRECYRVLCPGGIIRVVVPDLERICRAYLHELELLVNEPGAASDNYDWMLLELYDQTVREQSGGDMMRYLARRPLPNPDFVFERIGSEGRDLVRRLVEPPERRGVAGRLIGQGRHMLQRVRKAARALRTLPLRLLLGQSGARALEIGRFRMAGEVHQWMYDRYSLARALQQAGFTHARQYRADTSLISGWASFELDANAAGIPHKPDSLYMEAVKS